MRRYSFIPDSPEGTALTQPRVERRERSECRATLGNVPHQERNPEGVALTDHSTSHVCLGHLSHQHLSRQHPSRQHVSICGLLLLAMLLAPGCHRGAIILPSQLPPEYMASNVHTAQRLNLAGFARAGTNSQQIFPGDLLQVVVTTGLERDDQTPWPPSRVNDAGAVELPLIGAVLVAGLELDAAEARIRDESIRRGIYRAPNVSVRLVKRRTNRVTVVGAVLEPGVKELPASDSDLFAAIVASGGMTDDASTTVEIRRATSRPDAVRQASFVPGKPPSEPPPDTRDRIDLLQLEQAGQKVGLDDGAVVMVMPQPIRTVQVIGLVNTPSQVKMPGDRDMRVLDAIAQAGGVTLQVANKIHISRNVPGREEPIVIETGIREAKTRAHANVVLAAGDVISVEETPLTFTIETLRSFIRFGFSSTIPGF